MSSYRWILHTSAIHKKLTFKFRLILGRVVYNVTYTWAVLGGHNAGDCIYYLTEDGGM